MKINEIKDILEKIKEAPLTLRKGLLLLRIFLLKIWDMQRLMSIGN